MNATNIPTDSTHTLTTHSAMDKKRIPDTPDEMTERKLSELRFNVREYEIPNNTVRMSRLVQHIARRMNARGFVVKRRSISSDFSRFLLALEETFGDTRSHKPWITFQECVLGGSLLSVYLSDKFHIAFKNCLFTSDLTVSPGKSSEGGESESDFTSNLFLERLEIVYGKCSKLYFVHNVVRKAVFIRGIECDRLDLTLNDFREDLYIGDTKVARLSKLRSNHFRGTLHIADVIFEQPPDFKWSVFHQQVYCNSVANWDLRYTRGFEFDGQVSTNSALDPHAKVGWSTLRRVYSGPRLIINLALLFLFVARHAAVVFVWSAAAIAAQLIAHLFSGSAVQIRLPPVESVPVWKALFGYGLPWYEVLGTVVVICATVVRSLLTVQVSSLRDLELQTGRSPYRWRPPDAPRRTSICKSWMALLLLRATEYGPLLWVHKIFRWVFLASTFYVIFSIGRALVASIPLLRF